ncbi:hypothetical protein EG68_01501 [Paragonimus skrjabini miyazakii]|uniref:Peptidase A2 domain-containing protein n=1 Tax=Paragonimus skrjabini miyazakii TaxID=59628 RepID=A0A8S9Z2H7_9TREM|nr:hypothetical protein EG68_01501 [Paragonimus skrjabini miyazakii]
MPGTSGPKKAEDSEGPSFFGKLFTSIIALLSSVTEGGHMKTQSTPTPPAPEKFRVGGEGSCPCHAAGGEALDIAIDEGIIQGDITEGTFRRLRACFTTGPHQLEVCRQFHGRIQHPGEKLTAFIRELRRLCAEGFTDDTSEVREQRILQQALEGTRDTSTRRAFLTAAPTSIQEALDRAGTIEQVNGVLERDQQYRTREIAPVQYRPLARPQPFNRQERYGPQRMQRPPYQKPYCYYCSLYGKRAYRCGHNRGVTRPLSKLICPSLVLNNCHIRSPTFSGLLWSAPSVLLVDTGAACCLISKRRVSRQVLPQQDSGVRLVAANGTDIRSVGWLNVPVTLGEKVREHPMLVVDNLP